MTHLAPASGPATDTGEAAPGPSADTGPATELGELADTGAAATVGSDGTGMAANEVDTRGMHVAECAAWTVVWLGVLTAGVDVWGFWWSSPLTVVLGPSLVLAGLSGMAATWLLRSPRAPLLQGAACVGVVLSILFPQVLIIHTRLFYATDSAAFDQASARALLQGHDPYTVSLASAARLFKAPSHSWTYTVGGGHVTHASYPAASFLFQVPAMALGMRHMVVDWMDLLAWCVCAVLLFALLPVSLRWLAGLLGLTPIYLGMFSSGGTDALFLPFLLLAVWRWDRYGAGRAAGVANWLGPVALGVACAVKQTPWFCVPILVAGVALEARAGGAPASPRAARYAGTVAGVFLLFNLPFILWQPAAWARGTFLPFIGGLVADGQGLVSLATHGVTGGVGLAWLSVAGALAYVAVVCAFVAYFPALKRVWLLALPVVFFFSPRSLSSYLVDLVPVAVVAAVSVHGAQHRPAPLLPPALARRRGWLLAGPAAGVVAAGALAFSAHPLRIGVDTVQWSATGHRIEAVTVTVTNETGGSLTPHFMVNPGAGADGFWSTSAGGRLRLGPRRSETVTLVPPAPTTAPQYGARWLVLAYTTGPDALSTSGLQTWRGPNS